MSKADRKEYRRWREKKEDTRTDDIGERFGHVFIVLVLVGTVALCVVSAFQR